MARDTGNPLQECLKEDVESIDPKRKSGSLGNFIKRIFRRRKYKRHEIEFDQSLRARIHQGSGVTEVVPLDVSAGGMGFSTPESFARRLKQDEFIRIELFDDSGFSQIVSGTVRYVKKSPSSQSMVGVRFESPSPSLVKHLKRR